MNDPTCKMRNNPNHTCHDKFGEKWDRPGAGPRPGTHCVTVVGDELAKAAAMDELGALLGSMMAEPDDNDDCGMVLG